MPRGRLTARAWAKVKAAEVTWEENKPSTKTAAKAEVAWAEVKASARAKVKVMLKWSIVKMAAAENPSTCSFSITDFIHDT